MASPRSGIDGHHLMVAGAAAGIAAAFNTPLGGIVFALEALSVRRANRQPITAFIIVMEMVAGQTMVLSLMATALLASGVSRMLTPPMYNELMHLMMPLLPAPPPPDTVRDPASIGQMEAPR